MPSFRYALPFAIAATFLAAACFGSVNEDNFYEQLCHQTCQFEKSCSKFGFFYDYDDVPDCFDECMDDEDDFYDSVDGCDFDKDNASSCLSDFGMSCKAAADEKHWADDCWDVYDCN